MRYTYRGRPDGTWRRGVPPLGRASPGARTSPAPPAQRPHPNAVWITGELTSTSATRARREVEATRGDLLVIIDSIGGVVTESFELAAAIKERAGKTTAAILRAESAAVVVAAACDDRAVARDGTVAVHAPSFCPAGYGLTSSALPLAGQALNKTLHRIADALAEGAHHAGKYPPSYYEYLMCMNDGQGRTFDAEAAVLHGLADRVSAWPSAHIRSGREP